MPAESPTPSDEELARATQSGDVDCFEELVFRYETRLYRFLARTCRNDEDGADLTQETFVTAYSKIGSYRPSQSFATWLFTIARRKCIDHLRSQSRIQQIDRDEASEQPDPSESMASRDEKADLWRQVREALSADQFHVLWLYYVEDMSLPEMSRVLGRSTFNLKVILFRCRQMLAKRWKVSPPILLKRPCDSNSEPIP